MQDNTMKDTLGLDNLENIIVKEAKAEIQNAIQNYSQFSQMTPLKTIVSFNGGEYEWIGELIKDIIDSAPFNQFSTITRDPNFWFDFQASLDQGMNDTSLRIKIQGGTEEQTNNLTACFIGGSFTANGETIQIDKTMFPESQVQQAADKLADYFKKKIEKKYGEE